VQETHARDGGGRYRTRGGWSCPGGTEANFGYRAGKSAKDALRKIWREIEEGREWIVDADLKDFFGSVNHGKLLTLINQRVSDGRVLGLIAQMLIAEINPVIRGWGNYYRKAHVRKLFAKLDRWILQRIWSHCTKRWRNTGWKTLPEKRLYGELGLVKLIHLIPSLQPSKSSPL
jgi:hypothetical protein